MNQIINKLENNFYAVTYVTETGDTLCPRMFVQVKQKKNGKQKYSVHQLSKACKKFNNITDLKSYLIEIVAGENKNKNHSDYLPKFKRDFSYSVFKSRLMKIQIMILKINGLMNMKLLISV